MHLREFDDHTEEKHSDLKKEQTFKYTVAHNRKLKA